MFENNLGATHKVHASPHIASAIQSVITLVITLLFWLTLGNDVVKAAYIYEYGVLAVLGTMAILLVQALCCFAVIWYFQVRKVHPGNIVDHGRHPRARRDRHALRRATCCSATCPSRAAAASGSAALQEHPVHRRCDVR